MRKNAGDIYEQHALGVYRYLYSLCGDADTAEELTQETFCQAIKGMSSYRGEASPLVWLCAIAKRLWFKELERMRRNLPLDEEDAAHLPAPDDVEQTVWGKGKSGRFCTAQCRRWTEIRGKLYACGWRASFPLEK